jgi:hypothetical protein
MNKAKLIETLNLRPEILENDQELDYYLDRVGQEMFSDDKVPYLDRLIENSEDYEILDDAFVVA